MSKNTTNTIMQHNAPTSIIIYLYLATSVSQLLPPRYDFYK